MRYNKKETKTKADTFAPSPKGSMIHGCFGGIHIQIKKKKKKKSCSRTHFAAFMFSTKFSQEGLSLFIM